MSFDIDQEEKLIELVKCNPILYDKKLDGYRNKKLKDRIFEEIGSTFEISGQECTIKWKNLRSQCLAHRRKLRSKSGDGAGPRPYIRHELAMQFFSDGTDDVNTYSNVCDNEEDAINDCDLSTDMNLDIDDNEPKNASDDKRSKMSTSLKGHRSHTKRKSDVVDEEILKILKADGKDKFETFGEFVAAKLRDIHQTSPKAASELQLQITSMMHQTEFVELA